MVNDKNIANSSPEKNTETKSHNELCVESSPPAASDKLTTANSSLPSSTGDASSAGRSTGTSPQTNIFSTRYNSIRVSPDGAVHQNLGREQHLRKKRGRGRPPKLKSNLHEKQINCLMDEESSMSSQNSNASYERDPICDEFESCNLTKYDDRLPSQYHSEKTPWGSSNSRPDGSHSPDMTEYRSVIQHSSPHNIVERENSLSNESQPDIASNDQIDVHCDSQHAYDNPEISGSANKSERKHRTSNRLRGRTKIQNGHKEEQLDDISTSKPSNGVPGCNSDDSSETGQFRNTMVQDASSQNSKDFSSDLSMDSNFHEKNVASATTTMNVKSRWQNSRHDSIRIDGDIISNIDHEKSLPDSFAKNQDKLSLVTHQSNPNEQIHPKRENRTRGERRASSKRTSPISNDQQNPSFKEVRSSSTDYSSNCTIEAMKNYSILKEMITPAQKLEVEQRLGSFEHISTNVFICQRRRNKQTGDMECDCSISKEDISIGKKGCGDDCLNRLLMVECNKNCSLGSNCGNKRFQNVENAKTEVFKTENKGVGLRAAEKISRDEFIMEYVGDVLDPQRFHKRAKKYSQNDVKHFYFMALSTDYIIDATAKGNLSRFINHSCDPNSETQKWTVNGELRVGFFSKRKILPGEEITFDYKYERYGQHAQKCYCGSSNCRGWLGGEPEKECKDSSDEETLEPEDEGFTSSSEEQEEYNNDIDSANANISDNFSPKDDPGFSPKVTATKVKRSTRKIRRTPRKIKNFETDEFEEEIERLKITGIRTKSHTVELCRLMVRVTDTKTRLVLSHLLLDADAPCRRLFLDYHGLKILNSWMSDLTWKSSLDLNVKIALEDVLYVLNIPHKTMIVESNVWQTISRWAIVESTFVKPIDSSDVIKDDIKSNTSEATATANTLVPSNELNLEHISPEFKYCPTASPKSEKDAFLTTNLDSIVMERSSLQKNMDEKIIVNNETLNEMEISESLPSHTVDQHVITKQSIKEEEPDPHGTIAVKQTEQIAGSQIPASGVKHDFKPECSKEDGGEKLSINDEELDLKILMIREKAKSLIGVWETLKEVFKIPRKELVKLRVEHERELEDAEQHSIKTRASTTEDPNSTGFGSINQQRVGNPLHNRFGYERNRPTFRPHSPPPKSRETRCSRFDDKTGRLNGSGLTRDHRRFYISQKFEMEKEEKRKRDLLQAWHENKCYYLRLDPAITPMFPEIPEFYFDPTVGTWYQMPELPPQIDVWGKLGFPHMARLPDEAYRETDSPLPDPTLIYPPGVVKVSYLYGQPMSLDPSFNNAQVDIPEPEQPRFSQDMAFIKQDISPPSYQNSLPLCYIDPDTGQEVPIPEELQSNLTHNQIAGNNTCFQSISEHSSNTFNDRNSDLISSSSREPLDQCKYEPNPNLTELDSKSNIHMPFQRKIIETFPSSMKDPEGKSEQIIVVGNHDENLRATHSSRKRKTNTVVMKLPTSWRVTKDRNGRVYYYNNVSKTTQWVPPPGTESIEENESLNQDPEKRSNSSSHQIDMLGATPESEDEDVEQDNEEDSLMDEDGDESDIDEEEDADMNLDIELDAKSLDNPQGPYSDLSAQERNLLLRFSKLSKEERQNERRQKRERDREKKEYERKRRRERHGKHRKDGLVTEHLIPKRGEQEKTDLMTFQEMRERLANRDAIRERQEIEERAEAERDREEERVRQRQVEKERREQAAAERQAATERQAAHNQIPTQEKSTINNIIDWSPVQQTALDTIAQKGEMSSTSPCEQPSTTTTAAADTSSEVSKKIKETFMKEVSKIIVKVLDPFRKADATRSRITTIEDFKHLAKKLTEYILLKELKHCPRIEDLRFTDSVRKKTAEFVRKYMLKFKETYKRSPLKI